MADLPYSDVLNVSLGEGWLSLTMDDPARKNALSDDMVGALSSILSHVADDRSVRGITLRGANGIFCSGGDLKGMGGAIMSGDKAAVAAMSVRAARLFRQVAEQPQPVLALVDGPALAGGLGLVCCADIVAVTAGAQFALTEVKLGIPPAQIAPYVVARLGLPTAKRLMLTAAKFGGDEAARIGLADRIVEDANDLDTVEGEIKRQVLACAPDANAATKALAIASTRLSPDEMMARAADAFADCLLSDEGREGIASFLEKRKPKWHSDG